MAKEFGVSDCTIRDIIKKKELDTCLILKPF
ncbi:MAG: hypothetical protein DRO67_00315 [Candidatus Asgardarchaeum californiense]|nr:MAG: hypothetical protein DRO67_00315 [Candidatus Asgardarchaeum californiense]